MFDSMRWVAMAFLLVPVAALTAQQGVDPIPDAATLKRQFDEAQREWNLARRAASVAKDTEALARLREERPQDAFVPKFAAGAAAHAGKEQAVPYLAWLV